MKVEVSKSMRHHWHVDRRNGKLVCLRRRCNATKFGRSAGPLAGRATRPCKPKRHVEEVG